MRSQVIFAPLRKFLQQVRCPIGLIVFQAVAEDGVRRMIAKGLHETVAHCVKVCLDRPLVVVVEDKTFGAERGALHCHARAAGDKENSRRSSCRVRRNFETGIFNRDSANRLCVLKIAGVRQICHPECCQQLLARRDVW